MADPFILSRVTVCGPCTDLFIEAARYFGIKPVVAENAAVRLKTEPLLGAPETSRIRFTGDCITVFGTDESGIARGIWTLLEHAEVLPDGNVRFTDCSGAETPDKPFRGVHMYLPPCYGMDECRRFLAIVSRLGYNTVILEIGGSMAYDSHPEIADAWQRFCYDAHTHTGGPQGLQASDAYWKDSTHVESAAGGVLSKAQVRAVADYCRLMRLEVIPELQGLSHAYYLTLPHPEIAERPFERWPDSWCPSMDESYSLYFDCAEEVLEVIRPRRVSIGHDEVRVLGECPRCAKRSGAELLAGDINRLHDFYASHGVSVCMWGEKLLDYNDFQGRRTGGAEVPLRHDRYGRPYKLPRTAGAASLIPKDILMLNWTYSQSTDTEKQFASAGFRQIFGNFKGSTIADYPARSGIDGILGAEVSTWCIPNEIELGGNGWFYELVFSALVLRRHGYCDAKREAYDADTRRMLPAIRDMMHGSPAKYGSLRDLKTLALPGGSTALSAAASADAFTLGTEAERLVFFHAAENPPARRTFSWYFLDPAPRIPASYAVDYADGLTLRVPVTFPEMTGLLESADSFFRPQGNAAVSEDIDDDRAASVKRDAPTFAPADPWRSASLYFCRTEDSGDAGKTVWACEWVNPHPQSPVVRVRLLDEPDSEMKLRCFGVGAI